MPTNSCSSTLHSFMQLMSWRNFFVGFEVHPEKLCQIKIRNCRKQTSWNMLFLQRWIFLTESWFHVLFPSCLIFNGEIGSQSAFQSVGIFEFKMFVWNVLIDWRGYLESTREQNHPLYLDPSRFWRCINFLPSFWWPNFYYDSCFLAFGFVALNVIRSKLTIWLVSLSFQLSWGCGSSLADSSSGACQCVKGCLVSLVW